MVYIPYMQVYPHAGYMVCGYGMLHLYFKQQLNFLVSLKVCALHAIISSMCFHMVGLSHTKSVRPVQSAL
jgi:predicted class III extradiol MEMO1 family dioxygenase